MTGERGTLQQNTDFLSSQSKNWTKYSLEDIKLFRVKRVAEVDIQSAIDKLEHTKRVRTHEEKLRKDKGKLELQILQLQYERELLSLKSKDTCCKCSSRISSRSHDAVLAAFERSKTCNVMEQGKAGVAESSEEPQEAEKLLGEH